MLAIFLSTKTQVECLLLSPNLQVQVGKAKAAHEVHSM